MLKAKGTNIVAKPIPQKDQKGVVLLGEENPYYVEVVSVGQNVDDIYPGEHILTQGELKHHTVNGQKYYILSSVQVLASVKAEE